MKYTVYSACAEEVKKKLDKIANKAKQYNVAFSYTISEEYAKTICIYTVENGVSYKIGQKTISAIDFEINHDDFIKSNGWEVVAKIEHGNKGNIVTPFNDYKVPEAWFNCSAKCDHCNTNHQRKYTYMVKHESGVIKQVGKSCLHDYTGINPYLAAKWAEVTDIFPKTLDCCENDVNFGYLESMYLVTDIIAHAYESIKKNGYVKSTCPNSTKRDITKRFNNHSAISEESAKTANDICNWLLNDCENSMNDLIRNCNIIVKSKYAKINHFGLLAYMPIAYKDYLERKAKEEEKKQDALSCPSEYIGNIGNRLSFVINKAELITTWANMYGTTYLYKFVDVCGNILVWYASKCIDLSEHMEIKATIKDHKEREGIKQTIITRCTVK